MEQAERSPETPSPAPGTEVEVKKKPRPLRENPFKNGFVPNGRRKSTTRSYMTSKHLMQYMLTVELTVEDLPLVIADHIRNKIPGFLEKIERKFTMRQIMELTQIQLLFSPSDYVKQDAINAIKDRIDGKPLQRHQIESTDVEPTLLVLPGGRQIVI